MYNQPYPPGPDDPTIKTPRAMPETRQQTRSADGRQVESHDEYVEDENMMRANMSYGVARFVYFLLGVVEVIMGLRFIFRLLGANQGSGFAMFLYSLSYVFVSPFNGIFNDQTIGSTSVFETSTLVAMLVYALIAWGIVSLGRLVLSTSLADGQRVVRSRRSRTTP